MILQRGIEYHTFGFRNAVFYHWILHWIHAAIPYVTLIDNNFALSCLCKSITTFDKPFICFFFLNQMGIRCCFVGDWNWWWVALASCLWLTLYTIISVCIFSTLFFIHFLRCWQGEFVCQSKGSFPGDHFLYSHDLNVWFRSDIVGRN